jgi:ribulose-5-phosphate 4-epimerase/fuculose-1-phosphate aldolase
MSASEDAAGLATTHADAGAAVPVAPASLRQELALANRILFHQGVVDGFGHVSLRHPARLDCFLLARSMGAHAAVLMRGHGSSVVGGSRQPDE